MLCTCVGHNCFNALIVVKCWCNVATSHGVVAPCSALARLVMDEDFSAGWHHGCGIERICAFHCFESQKCWVLVAGTHHVKCDVALFGEATQVGDGKRGGKSGHASHEVVFPSAFSHSAWFMRCKAGSMYCSLVCLPEMKSLTLRDDSLSILCRSGLNPLVARYAFVCRRVITHPWFCF